MKDLPNIKSAKKRVDVAKTNTAKNAAIKTSVRTSIKKFNESLNSSDKNAINAAYTSAVSTVDKAVSSGVIKKNTANNKKATLGKKLNSVEK